MANHGRYFRFGKQRFKEANMPKGTKVDKVYQALKREGKDEGTAARIAQAKTGQALATGKPPKHKGK